MSSKLIRAMSLCGLLLSLLPACGPISASTIPPVAPTTAPVRPPLTQEPSATAFPPTPSPTATRTPETTATPATAPPPRLSQSPDLILAVHKPARRSPWPGDVVYTLPEVDRVLLASELTYYLDLKVDIYYPPDYKFERKLPIVILSHGLVEKTEFDKDIPTHMGWAKLIAASGMIAISAQAADHPVENSYHVMEFLSANADALGVDLTRIGFWACSTQGKPVFKALEDQKLPYRDGFKAGVFTYLDLHGADPGAWPKNFSVFVVKAGSDRYIDGASIDNFVVHARSNQIPVAYIELKNAPHAFDSMLDTQESRDTVAQALAFFKSKLLE